MMPGTEWRKTTRRSTVQRQAPSVYDALSSSRGTSAGDVGDHENVEEHRADDDHRDLRALADAEPQQHDRCQRARRDVAQEPELRLEERLGRCERARWRRRTRRRARPRCRSRLRSAGPMPRRSSRNTPSRHRLDEGVPRRHRARDEVRSLVEAKTHIKNEAQHSDRRRARRATDRQRTADPRQWVLPAAARARRRGDQVRRRRCRGSKATSASIDRSCAYFLASM